MTQIVHERSITGSDYCGGCGQDWPCQHERLRQEVEHWKGMYEQANQQARDGLRRAIVGVDPPVPGAYRIIAACHCGRPLLFPGDTGPWCQGCNMSASTCDCVAVAD